MSCRTSLPSARAGPHVCLRQSQVAAALSRNEWNYAIVIRTSYASIPRTLRHLSKGERCSGGPGGRYLHSLSATETVGHRQSSCQWCESHAADLDALTGFESVFDQRIGEDKCSRTNDHCGDSRNVRSRRTSFLSVFVAEVQKYPFSFGVGVIMMVAIILGAPRQLIFGYF